MPHSRPSFGLEWGFSLGERKPGTGGQTLESRNDSRNQVSPGGQTIFAFLWQMWGLFRHRGRAARISPPIRFLTLGAPPLSPDFGDRVGAFVAAKSLVEQYLVSVPRGLARFSTHDRCSHIGTAEVTFVPPETRISLPPLAGSSIPSPRIEGYLCPHLAAQAANAYGSLTTLRRTFADALISIIFCCDMVL